MSQITIEPIDPICQCPKCRYNPNPDVRIKSEKLDKILGNPENPRRTTYESQLGDRASGHYMWKDYYGSCF